jgi:protein CpxP
MEDRNTTARKAALWVVLVFVLGGALGSMGGYVFAHHKFAVTNAATAGMRPINESERRAQKLQELVSAANLTPEQTKQVDAIIGEMLTKIKTVRKTTDPQVNELRKDGQDRIRAVLTDEQKPRFEEFIRRMDEERKRAGM